MLNAVTRAAAFLGIIGRPGPLSQRHKSLAAFQHELRERTDWYVCDLVAAINLHEVICALRATPTRGKRFKRWDGLTCRLVGVTIEPQGPGCFRVTYDVASICMADLCEQQASTG